MNNALDSINQNYDNGTTDNGFLTCPPTTLVECTGFRTQTMGAWGAAPNGNNPSVYLHNNFASAFPSGLIIGCGSNTLSISSADAINDFLPSSGTPDILPAGSMTDPGSSYNNTLAGQLVTAKLNMGFDSYDSDFSINTINTGDLIITSGMFAGWTMNQLCAEADNVIGGCSNAYTPSEINEVLSSFNENYDNGTVDNGFLSCESYPPLNVTCSSTPGNCTTSYLGSVSVSITGGVPPYVYSWNNGFQSSSLNSVAAGDYTVIVTDNAGNTASCTTSIAIDNTCPAPVNVHFDSLSYSSASMCWDAVPCAYAYEIQWKKQGAANWIYRTVYAPETCTIFTNVNSSVTDLVQIRTICTEDSSSKSSWGDMIYFKNFAGCPPPTNLYANNITSSSAKLHWTPVAGVANNQVSYRKAGATTFTKLSKQNATATSIKLSGLSSSTKYEWFVTSRCDDGVKDSWGLRSAIKTFTTLSLREELLPEIENHFSIYPNPATNHIHINADLGESSDENYTVEIVGVMGRVVFSESGILNDGTVSKDVQLDSSIPDGAYFVIVRYGGKQLLQKLLVSNDR